MARVKPPQERRREERQRTRLRSGKIVNLDGRFVVECQFIDIAPPPMERRSGCGRPYTCRNNSGSLTIIMRALLARLVWRKGREFGVEFIIDPTVIPLDEERLAHLAGKYYSL